MNIKNSNVPFQDFMNADLSKHWSWSNFNRHLITCEALSKLPINANVLEIGAADSPIKKMMQENFNRYDLDFIRTDVNKDYTSSRNASDQYYFLDIEQEDCWTSKPNKFDAVILCEVIEHVKKQTIVIDECSKLLKQSGLFIVSTPTPPLEAEYERLVWPEDHECELTLKNIYKLLNYNFKVIKTIGWSMEEREFNRALEVEADIQKIYCKLKDCMPESYLRALIPLLSEPILSRQNTFICKKRRLVEGR